VLVGKGDEGRPPVMRFGQVGQETVLSRRRAQGQVPTTKQLTDGQSAAEREVWRKLAGYLAGVEPQGAKLRSAHLREDVDAPAEGVLQLRQTKLRPQE
jgi:hypothetical protein